ncbi:DUF1573 domain-containing protein [Niabella sp. W65]|nr:DUF1573 domain-containing protein [Niabella sp. W65]MCH7363275.1 DUF1573 domain-containing protein [Niabella sp. W65]ULT39203.1 DUF1573 domain-containing protein [Niabella sp. I65]
MSAAYLNALFFLIAGLLVACGSGKGEQENDKVEQQVKTVQIEKPIVEDSIAKTSISWIDSTFKDIGVVRGKDSALITYKFKNTGDKPLIIQAIKSSCGCTVVDSLKEPVLPGKESLIKVKFYAADQAVATHEKHVYVITNTKPHHGTTLSFKVEVKE